MYYEVIIREGIACKFLLTLEGLQAYAVSCDTNREIFGMTVLNNSTRYGEAIYYAEFEDVEVNSDDNSTEETTGVPVGNNKQIHKTIRVVIDSKAI